MRSSRISVVIPLYNKAAEVERTLLSVVSQVLLPLETVVVDDGSTDGSAEIAERVAELHPAAAIRILRQPNGGVSAARNRAVAEARGEFVALLDADDRWMPDHLANIEQLIDEHPDCGIYASAFMVDDGRRLVDADTPAAEGVIDFFAEAVRSYAVIPSAAVLRRTTLLAAGGFPEGMRMGEDQFVWVKMARLSSVAVSRTRTVIYSRAASNRSAAGYRPESCGRTIAELLDDARSDAEREYIARIALGKGLLESVGGDTASARRTLELFGFTRCNRRALLRLRVVNALPVCLRAPAVSLYNRLAWLLSHKGI